MEQTPFCAVPAGSLPDLSTHLVEHFWAGSHLILKHTLSLSIAALGLELATVVSAKVLVENASYTAQSAPQ